MIVDPAIAALRSDRASQRSVQARLLHLREDWRASDRVQALQRDLFALDRGADFDECRALARLFADHALAMGFAMDWSERLLRTLRDAPLGEVPFRHRHSSGYSTMQLLSCGGASLNLSAYERQDKLLWPQTAVFTDRKSVELILTGSVRGTCHRLIERDGSQSVLTQRTAWTAGDRIETGGQHTRQFVEVKGALLVLQVTCAPKRPGPTREYRLADSGLIRCASGNKDASRDMLALAVLGALEHHPSLGVMADVALDSSREADLRWEAVRQTLALDPGRGFALLNRLAKRREDALAQPAIQLRGQLATAYPRLVATPMEAA